MPIKLGTINKNIPFSRAYLGNILKYQKLKNEQLVNYTMIYDGSLGESGINGANTCQAVTGGFNVNTNLDAQMSYSGTVTFNSNSIYMEGSNAKTQARIVTKNKIDITNYTKFCGVLKMNMTNASSSTWTATWLIENDSETTGEQAYLIWSSMVRDEINNKKVLKTKDLSATTIKNFYFASQVGNAASSFKTAQGYIYSIFLTKADNWQILAEKAGITASSIDDVLTNSTTLLSNKEAVDFMIYNCTGDFMVSAVANSTFLTALNNSAYKTIIWSNEHWAKFLNMVV